MDTKRLKQVLARIERERDRLSELADQFRGAIAYLDEESDSELLPLTPGKEMDNAMQQILAARGQPMHPKIICDLLGEKGINVPGENPVNNTRSHLSLDDRFEPVGNGLWGLKAWQGDGWSTAEEEETTHQNGNHAETPERIDGGVYLIDNQGRYFQTVRNDDNDDTDLPF